MGNDHGLEAPITTGSPGTETTPAHPAQVDAAKPAETFHQYRPRLFAIAYRMLGSASDAEDVLQEAFIRWQQTCQDEVRSPEGFLVTVVSRLCINQMQSARKKREQYLGPWLPEPVLTGEMSDPHATLQMDESLSVAFLVLLERLTPMERAVFLLREVFDYEYADVALMLGQSEPNCRQILRRARQHLREGRPRFGASRQQQEALLQRFLQASAQGDMAGLLELMSKDIVLYADGGGKATAVPNPIYGADNVVRFLFGARRKLLPAELVLQVARVNGQPGVVTYHQGRPFGVLTMEVAEGRIRNIFIVSNPDKLARLPGLSAGIH